MKYHVMHDDHDVIICTPQYWREYELAIRRNYPDHDVEVSTLVSNGNAYLFNKQKLREEYEKKVNENQD